MAEVVELPEERLKSFLCQLQAESRILDRIIYKNKNQHRRCSYFQYLLKKTKTKIKFSGKMVEPILKAATEISTLLARSFFMGFSMMILSLLARLRILVQQMLLDVVSVFNNVSSLAQKKQSIKITQDGIEVFREYYPNMEGKLVVLECHWKTDKFVLVESSDKGKISNEGGSSEAVQTPGISIKYHTISASLEDDEFDSDVKEGEQSVLKRKRPDSPTPLFKENFNHGEQVQIPSAPEAGLENALQQTGSTLVGCSSFTCSVTSSISSLSKPNSRVAFISVKRTALSASDSAAAYLVDNGKDKMHIDEENALFSLFTGEETTGSIF